MSIAVLLQDSDPYIRTLAERAQRYRAQLDAGELSVAEYESLSEQLVSAERLAAEATTAERRLALQQAVQIVRVFLGVLI